MDTGTGETMTGEIRAGPVYVIEEFAPGTLTRWCIVTGEDAEKIAAFIAKYSGPGAPKPGGD